MLFNWKVGIKMFLEKKSQLEKSFSTVVGKPPNFSYHINIIIFGFINLSKPDKKQTPSL